MTCERCGRPYRVYSSWHEPPENHYARCDRCNRTWYFNCPEDCEEGDR